MKYFRYYNLNDEKWFLNDNQYHVQSPFVETEISLCGIPIDKEMSFRDFNDLFIKSYGNEVISCCPKCLEIISESLR